jgi:hypothetical protein
MSVISALAVTPGSISSPAQYSKLTGTSVLFGWTAGTSVTDYQIKVGITSGGSEITTVDAGTATSYTVSGLPSNGEKIFVTLISTISSTQYPKTYEYYAYGTGTASTLSTPAANAKLAASSQTFAWTAGSGISQYVFLLGTSSGGSDLANVTTANLNSGSITGLPTNGEKLYVTLKSLNGKSYLQHNYTLYASGTGTAAVLSTPAPSSKLASGGTGLQFTWTAGNGISQYTFLIGTSPGGNDVVNEITTSTAYTVATPYSLPTNGEKLYVTLKSLNGKSTLEHTYVYYANGTGTAAVITSPAPNGKLLSTIVDFNWSTGTGITEYQFIAGTTYGAADLANVTTKSTDIEVGNIPTTGGKIYVSLKSLNGASWLLHNYVFYTDTMSFNDNTVNQALISTPYANQVYINGGTPPYTVSLFSGALPAGMSIVNGNPAKISGTPTTAGTSTFVLKATDNVGNMATSTSLSLTVSPAPDGEHNAYFNGRYTCAFRGFLGSDNSRFGFASSIAANGTGSITSGYYDGNGRTVGASSGTLTGTYNLGSNNNGVLAITTGSSTSHYVIMANQLAGPTANTIALIESDDVGASPSGQHGAGVCYLASPSAFVSGTVNTHGFVLAGLNEDNVGTDHANGGTFQTSGGTSSGGNIGNVVIDQVQGSKLNLDLTGSGTYTFPSTAPSFASVGRLTATLIGTGQTSGNSYALYVIDANRLFMIKTEAGDGFELDQVFTQQKSSFSVSDLSGAFVLYDTLIEEDSSNTPQRSMSEILQGTGNATGSVTVNQSYSLEENADGSNRDYRIGDADGTMTGLTVAPNGRVTGLTGTLFYLFDTNKALVLEYGTNGAGYASVGIGQIEPQFSTSGLTDSTVVGSYLVTTTPQLSAGGTSGSDVLALAYPGSGTTDNFTGTENRSGYQDFDYADPVSAAYSFTSTSLGTANISQGGQVALNCILISATRQVCMETDSGSPHILIFQQ